MMLVDKETGKGYVEVDYVAQLDNQIQQLNIAKNQIQSQLNNPTQTNQQQFTEQKN